MMVNYVPARTLTGTLLLPIETVAKTGNLFPLMALMLRAAGMRVVVVGAHGIQQRAAALNIPFTGFRETSYKAIPLQRWKAEQAEELLAEGPVLWPDVDFQHWGGPNVSATPGLTILNVGALLAGGVRPGLDAKGLPG